MSGPNETITGDLMDKCASDVRAALLRTLSIAPPPHLPIAMAAGSTVMGVMARFLEEISGGPMKPSTPDPECVLLAGLLCARMAQDPATGVACAYADLELLKKHALSKGSPS